MPYMPIVLRRTWIEASAAVLAAAVAGLTLMVPVDFQWADSSAAELQLVILNVPRATASGALAAVLTAAFCGMLGARASWLTALGGSAILLIEQIAAREATSALVTLNYLESVCAGILIGAVGSAALIAPALSRAFLLGGLSGVLIGDLIPVPATGARSLPQWLFLDPAPTALLAAVVAMTAAAGWLSRDREPRPEIGIDRLALRPVAVGAIMIAAMAMTSEWIAVHDNSLAIGFAGAAVTLVAASAGALLLPGRDGVLILAAVALAAARSAAVTEPRPGWTLLVLIVTVAAGLHLARVRPSPATAVAATIALAIVATLTADAARSAPIAILGTLALAAVAGFCFGSAVPGDASVSILAFGVLFVPSAVVAMHGHRFDRISHSRLWFHTPTPTHTAVPALVGVAITLGCAGAVAALYRLRPHRQVPSRV